MERSPGRGFSERRLKPGSLRVRGKAVSDKPSRQTTRNGMLRIGSIEQNVTLPVRKPAVEPLTPS